MRKNKGCMWLVCKGNKNGGKADEAFPPLLSARLSRLAEELEVHAEAELHLPRTVRGRRGSDHSKSGRASQGEVWRAEHDMVQHVRGLKDEHHAEPLAKRKVFGDRHVQIPGG